MKTSATKTKAQLKAMQAKAQEIAKTLNKEAIIVNKGDKQHIVVKPGNTYELSVKDGDVLNKDFDVIAKKVGEDLEVLLPNDTVVVFDNYFEICASDLSCLVSLPAEGSVYYVIEGGFTTLSDGSQVVHFYGDEATLSTIATNNFSSVAVAELLPMFEAGVSFTALGALGLTAVDLAGAGATAAADTILFGAILMGPVIEGNGLSVQAFKADGKTKVGALTKVNANGSFTVNLGDYKGVVILKVIDDNDGADYVDEATGAQVDLDITLLAVVDASSGGSIKVVVTPVTTLAAQQAGVTESGDVPSETTLDATTVNAANKGVANALGLTDIINDIPVAMINTDGSSSSSSNAYGKVLAALSGMDKSTGGVGETINTLKNALTGTGSSLSLSTTAKKDILDGAQQAELDNDNINSLTTDSAITAATTGATLTTTIKLGFQDTGSSHTDGIVKAYDLDGSGSGTDKGIKINVSGVTANNWVYTTDGGTTWAVGSGTSFDLPENSTAYNKSDIMVRTGTSTIAGTTGSVALAASGTLTVDGTAPTITISGDGTQGYLSVGVTQVDTWEYSLDSGTTWTTGSGDRIYLDAGQSWTAGAIQVRGKDVAGNEGNVSSSATVTTSTVTLSLANDTGSLSDDGKTNDATVNVSVSGSVAWQYRTTSSGAWIDATGTSFELPSGSTAASNVQVKISGTADGTAVNLGTFISASSVEVSTSAPSALTVTLVDTGSASDDFITSNKVVTVGGITGSNTWEYSTDGGANWKTGTSTSFDLLDNRSYVANQIQVRQTDEFGNKSTFATFKDTNANAVEVNIDTTAPTVTAFSTTTADGSYKVGDTITITATTSEKVVSGSTITVTLDTGDTVDLTASADGTTLTGTYTIDSSDTSGDLTVVSFTIGSTTKDLAGSAMTDTTVPSGKNISDTSAIVVDGTAPTITAFSATTTDGNYKVGDTITITATTSEAVKTGGQITVTLDSGGTAILTAASDGTTLTGVYTVGSSDTSSDLTVTSFAIGSGAQAVTDVAGNAMTATTLPSGSNIEDSKAIVIDTTAPTATLSSNIAPSADLTMTFAETVTAVSGKKITLYKSDGTQIEQFDAADRSKVTFSGNTVSINPADLDANTNYYVQIDAGAFKDTAGNDYAGISDTSSWSFTVAALTTSAVWSNGSTDVSSDGINIAELSNLSIKGSITNPSGASSVTISSIIFKATDGSGDIAIANDKIPSISGTTWELVNASIPSNLVDGKTYTIEVGLAASGSITGTGGNSTPVLIDKAAPATPTIAAVATDDVINLSEKNSAITGTTEAGSTVTLSIGGNTRTATVTNTTWSYTLTDADITAMGQGTESITATATDTNGNTATSSAKSITVDTVAPATPTIAAVATDDVINLSEKNSAITGTTEAGSTVTLSIGGNTRTATVTNTTWSYTLTDADITAMGQGTESITATATDTNGNTATSSAKSITVDTVAPATPTIAAVATDDVINLSEKNSAITGTTEAGSTVTLSIGGNTRTATVTNTTWSYTLTDADITAMGQGTESITATATDTNGNTATSSAKSITVDTVAPATPTIAAVATDDVINLSEKNSAITGTTEAGSTVTLSIGGNTRTATVTNTTWSYTLTDADITAMGQGTESITVTATDTNGNTATSSAKSITVDTVAPATPTIAAVATDDVINLSEKNSAITGTTEAGSTVTLSIGGNTRTATVTNTTWSYTLTDADITAMGQGTESITATATDTNGNTATSSAKSITVDTVAPATPTIAAVATDDVINLSEKNSAITGTTEAGSTVTLSIGGNTRTATVTNTTWSYTLTDADITAMGQGTESITATATDTNGNTATSSAKSITVDTVAPATPTIAAVATDDVINLSEKNSAITGTTEAGSTVTLSIASNTRAATVTGTTWSYTLTDADITAMGQGAESITATATDTVGNTATSAAKSITIDTTAPTAPTVDALTTNDTTPVITGTTGSSAALATGESLSVTISGATYSVTPASDGTWSLNLETAISTSGRLSALTDGNRYEVTATVTDAADNSTSDSSTNEISINTNPPTISSVTDNQSNTVTSSIVTYTVVFSHALDQDTFASADIKLINAAGTDITANWTIGTPTTSDGITWTVAVTPPTGANAIDVTAVRLKIDAGSIADIYGNVNADLVQSSSSQSFDTTPPFASTLTLNTDTGSNASDGITKDGVMNVGGLDTNLGSWQYSINGGSTWTIVSNGDTSFTLAPGTYGANLIRIRQTDSAGQTSTITKYTSALTVDTSIDAPMLSSAGGGNISTSSNLVLTFAENVSAVAGKNIVIKNSSNNAVVETIAANGAQVIISNGVVTINPTDANLVAGNNYYIEVDAGAFTDSAGNTSAVIAANDWDVSVNAMSTSIAVATDNKVNAAENGADITVSVTVSADSSILPALLVGDFTVTVVKDSDGSAVTLTGASYNSATGVWSATITGGGLTDAEAYTITADVTGSAGAASGVSAPQTTQAVTVDTTVPTLDTTTIATDAKVNISEVSGGFSITGTTTGLETGTQVSVLLNSVTYTASILANGTWSLNVYSIDAANLTDGSTYAVIVNASDAHGNPATQVLQNITVDRTAPVSTVAIDEVITSLPTITGQTSESSVEVKLDLDGDGVYGEVGEGTYTVSVSGGNWALDLSSVNADGTSSPMSYSAITASTLGVQVTATDDAGNATIKTEVVTKQASSYSISDSKVIEGETGTKTMTFIVTREGDLSTAGTVNYAVDTTLSSAKTGSGVENDYTGTGSGTVNFAAGENFKEITLTINADYYKEINQNIIVKLSNSTGGVVSKDTGIGEINEIDASAMVSAFSLKDVNSDLVTNAIRVRRSSDDAEMDIGFDKYGNLDTQALLKFVNNNDDGSAVTWAKGFVTTWYDQSSRAENAVQNTYNKQPVIVNNGALVTLTSTGEVAVSFNEGLNGTPTSKNWLDTERDGFQVSDTDSNTFTNVVIYESMEYTTTAQYSNSIVFGSTSIYPNYRGNLYWYAGSNSGHGRLAITNGAGAINTKLDVVFEANYNNVGNTGTSSKNYTDAAQGIYINGVSKARDGTLLGGASGSLNLDNGSDGWTLQNNQAKITEMFIYAANEQSTSIKQFLGSSNNDTFTYGGESIVTGYDGKAGYDTVYISGANNLDLTNAQFSSGIKSIELVHMKNTEANVLTINDAQLTTNGSILSVLMDSGDSIVYNSATLNHSATQEVVTFGTTGNDTINMSSFNELVYGRGGSDTFVYKSWSDAAASSSNDAIADFTMGTGAGKDTLNLADLLTGYSSANLADFLSLSDDGTNSSIAIDSNGDSSGTDLTITLTGVTGVSLATMISDANLILE
ncbi:Ig-like domain-containing protein [Bathymodiolus septemdierum thioautotrophic gill symbiont]|uniref:Ig-like domain-containing protein n=1 Tax=endosymbiont of Bathymodiolus septemdierum str. Myojin knoll TaxID=1303921 RepID=A0A0P0USE8_9GAMM|nr:Ig-like domain-containing protein [Bathymodiolus septemdierum thioautotrophic gill symbiont]BAS68020.1 hypothetical protein BSEPE_1029 [endosymbiont of Bathymodiolus septemdierum str. Myojin knoll]